MICTCGCRTSYCERTLNGHTERCQNCGRIEFYILPELEFGRTTIESFTPFPRTASLLSERHSRNMIGMDMEEY